MFKDQEFEIEGDIHGWWITLVVLPIVIIMIWFNCSLWTVSIGSGIIGVIVNEGISYFKKNKLGKQSTEQLK